MPKKATKTTEKKQRKPVKLSALRVERAVKNSFGIIKEIAAKLRCSRQALYDFLNKEENKYIYDLIANENDEMLDLAERALGKLLTKRNPDLATIKFVLTTKGKKRGYTLKYESEINNKNFDIQAIMKELENNLPLSVPYIERLARGEDILTVYGEFQNFKRTNISTGSSDKVEA